MTRWNEVPDPISSSARHDFLGAQQRFRGEDDERLAEIAADLAPQGVEIVRRARQVAHLDVVFGAELQIALDPRRGMLGPLPLVTVRQQHDETAHAQPFRLARAEELVDDDLRAIGEIAELRLPQHQVDGSARL